MVKPNGPRVSHGRLQHPSTRLKPGTLERNWVERGQSPVLPGPIEQIGRRADRHVREKSILLAPGVEPIPADPHRHVQIEPDRKTALARPCATVIELLMGKPLHEFKEAELAIVAPPQLIERGSIPFAPWLRPF